VVVVVVVVVAATPNYLRQASQNLGKYKFSHFWQNKVFLKQICRSKCVFNTFFHFWQYISNQEERCTTTARPGLP
jgi:hypothetical protein